MVSISTIYNEPLAFAMLREKRELTAAHKLQILYKWGKTNMTLSAFSDYWTLPVKNMAALAREYGL